MIGFPPKPISAQSAQSHDWDARATEVIAEARKTPLGQRRSDALGESGRLRIAAEDEALVVDKVRCDNIAPKSEQY
jgi:hypothetical protein